MSASVAGGTAVRPAGDGLKANRRASEALVSGVLSGLACYPSDVPDRGGLIEVEVRRRLGVGRTRIM